MTRHGSKAQHEAMVVLAMLPARGLTALAWVVALVTFLVAAPGLGR